jgi:D-beta-D-heptose 7-phosphate kinase/D-beta-D-heptose 1-phosphate adenosyltransferase
MQTALGSLAAAEQVFIVVGDFMLDKVTTGQLRGIANEAPISVFKECGGSKYLLGGAGNVCANLAALSKAGSSGSSNCKVAAVGLIGADEHGEALHSLCRAQGIISDFLIVDPQRPTTCKHRYYINNRLVFRSDNESTTTAEAGMELEIMNKIVTIVEATRAVCPNRRIKIILSDYNKGTLTDKLRQSIIVYAKGEHIETFVDPKTDLAMYYGCTFIKPNKTETARLGRIHVDEIGLEAAHRRIHELLDCNYSLITLAEAGMSLGVAEAANPAAAGPTFYNGRPSTQLEVIDVTGAGDVVLAIMAYMWGFGISYNTCLEIANYIAQKSVMHCGTYVVNGADWLAAMTAAAVVPAAKQPRVVFTNGCFDILHVGHLRLLEAARGFGDKLIVGINSDESVRRLKGPTRPIRSAAMRAEMLKALPWVDEVVVFDEDTPYELLTRLQPRPNVLVKGGDYKVADVVGRELVNEVVIFPFQGATDGTSTSSIIASVLSHHR